MPQAKTVTGVNFFYSGSLNTGLVVHKGTGVRISVEIIRFIRGEIDRRSPVLMGACRDNPAKHSVGEALVATLGGSPQYLSYVVPLLMEEGFCTVNGRRRIVISRQN